METHMANVIETAKAATIAHNDKDWDKVKALFVENGVYDEKATGRRIQGIRRVCMLSLSLRCPTRIQERVQRTVQSEPRQARSPPGADDVPFKARGLSRLGAAQKLS
jgi:hypothetical protein